MTLTFIKNHINLLFIDNNNEAKITKYKSKLKEEIKKKSYIL